MAAADTSSPAFGYLATLVREWAADFRSTVDSPLLHQLNQSVRVPADTTNVSGATVFAEHGSLVTDYPISIPFASYELFVTLLASLRRLPAFPAVMSLLYQALPFVKLHLSMAIARLHCTESRDFITPYIRAILEIVEYHGAQFEKHSSEVIGAQHLYARERSTVFVIDVLLALLPIQQVCRMLLTVFQHAG